MNKRGLSNVIVTLIIIVISLIAVGLVWGVAQQIISEGVEDISLAGFKIAIRIPNAEIDGSNIIVNVKRNVGSGNLTGIKFIFSDEKNSESKERTVSLKELESMVFNFTLNDLNILEVKLVSIAPIYLSDSGKEILGNIVDTYNIITSESTGGNGGNESGGGSVCGNSIVETGEQCDDGNTNDGDGCSSTCQNEGGSCVPATDPCGTAECGTVINGTCGNVICGICNSGFDCISGSCIQEISINSGIVDLTWPPEVNLFFDSFDLPTAISYTGNFVKFPGSLEPRCLLIIDYIFPSSPEDYNKSFVRLGTPNNEKSFVVNGNNYSVWESSSCGA